MSYEGFKSKIVATLREASRPMTWTEVRTIAALPQAFPNNQWVRRMEEDVGLVRRRESDGIIHWQLKESILEEPATIKVANKVGARSRRK